MAERMGEERGKIMKKRKLMAIANNGRSREEMWNEEGWEVKEGGRRGGKII